LGPLVLRRKEQQWFRGGNVGRAGATPNQETSEDRSLNDERLETAEVAAHPQLTGKDGLNPRPNSVEWWLRLQD